GVICLAILLASTFAAKGLLAAVLDFIYFVEIGIIAQAASLLASLVAINRRQSHTRFDIFMYQLVGLLAALGVFWVWEAADPEGALLLGRKATETVVWWGHTFGSQSFLLVSLALFTAWIFVGCYREMRLELKIGNGPFVWLGFMLFIGLYAA